MSADERPKWDEMSTEEKQRRARDLTTAWLTRAVDESLFTVLTGAAAIIMVILEHTPDEMRPFLRALLQDIFDGEVDMPEIDESMLN